MAATKLADSVILAVGKSRVAPEAALRTPVGRGRAAATALRRRRRADEPGSGEQAQPGRPASHRWADQCRSRTDQAAAGGRRPAASPSGGPAARRRPRMPARIARLAATDQAATGSGGRGLAGGGPAERGGQGRRLRRRRRLFRQIPMEEAVSHAGRYHPTDRGTHSGAGGEPCSGQLVTGAQPDLPVVRVIYLDPPRREIWLDQQHGVGACCRPGRILSWCRVPMAPRACSGARRPASGSRSPASSPPIRSRRWPAG